MTRTSLDTRPVVVGVDESASARDAALWAADLAAQLRGPLCLTHTVNSPGTLSSAPTPPWLREMNAATERVGAIPTTIEVRYGPVADQLIARSAEARLLVLGSYGGQGWTGMLAGTNALPLVARSACPLI